MNAENHNININNYKNNETVCYSFILLKGTILTSYTSACNKKDQKVLRFKNGTQHFCSQFHNNKFKCLVDLKIGENRINISYCCYKTELTINFKPRKTEYCVVPVYIVCNNHEGDFQAPETEDNSIQSACERIYIGARLIQSLIAEKFYEKGLSRKTFQLEGDLYPTEPKCRVFYSKLDFEKARKMSQGDLWDFFGRELMVSELKNENYKYLAFISCTKYRGDKFGPHIKTHEDIIGLTEAHVALGGGGLAIFGTACLYTWPRKMENVAQCFLNENTVDKSKYMDDSCYRGTLGGCFATTLGAVCHELCHAFDLGHTDDGVMGRGFDNIDKDFVFENPKRGNSKLIKNEEPPEGGNRGVVLKVTQNIVPRQVGIRYVPPVFKEGGVGKANKNGVFWTENCTVLLYYHRWFNSDKTSHVLELQTERKQIYSTAGIRIVEIRDNLVGMLLKWWDFSDKSQNTFSFTELKDLNVSSFVLIAQDSVGNILKESF